MLKPFEELVPTLVAELADLEVRRRKLAARSLQGWFVFAAILSGAGLVAFLLFRSQMPFLGFLVGVMSVIGAVGVLYFQLAQFTAEFAVPFKTEVIGRIAALITEGGLQYHPAGTIPEESYKASELFRRPYHRYSGEDLFTGQVGGTRISLSELHTQYKTESTDSTQQTATEWHTIFRGLFIVADFPKNFQGKTFVRPDQAENALGFLGRSLQKTISSGDEPLVQLEDPEFEKAFVVNATDQVEARYILSISLMKRMVDLRSRMNADLSFAFVRNQIFIAITSFPKSWEMSRPPKNLFEPDITKSITVIENLRVFYDDLASCLTIVEDLALNVHIWGK